MQLLHCNTLEVSLLPLCNVPSLIEGPLLNCADLLLLPSSGVLSLWMLTCLQTDDTIYVFSEFAGVHFSRILAYQEL